MNNNLVSGFKNFNHLHQLINRQNFKIHFILAQTSI